MVAYAPPAWLNEIANASFNLAPGAVSDVVLDVNGPLVTRGAHDCFITIASNDQFYLNSTMSPVIMLGVVGGCVSSTDTLYWGMNYPETEPPALGANYSVVYNSGTIAGDARNDGFMISIDGEEEYFCYFCGMLLFGQAEHKLAWTGTFDSDNWETLMTDPNCAAQCQTYFSRGIVLGEYWDGTDWADIYGEAGTCTYVDSVIAYDCAGAWDWYDHDCGYDNSLTMGISVKCTEYGAYGMPELNNFKICKLDITNRNAAPITDPIYYAQWVDHDLGNDYDEGYDFERYFFLDDYDVAWGGACEGSGFEFGTNVWGSGSIGHPMRGVITCRNDQLNGGYMFDSMYYWMSTVTGPRYQPGLDPIEDGCTDEFSDRQAIYLYDGFTFGANETISTGFYIFGYSHIAGGADTYDTALIISTALAAQQFSGFGRGDMNGDMKVNLVDVVLLWNIIDGTVPPLKYRHLTDVNADGTTDLADVVYLADYHFNQGPAPVGEWTLPDICPQP
jgi:hypothetical protein